MKVLFLIFSFVFQRPALPAVQSGTVTGEIRSSEGQVLPGVSVQVMAGDIQDSQSRFVPLGISFPGTLTQTDSMGRYRLENIPPGRYYILAQPHGSETGLPTFYPGGRELQTAKRVIVRPNSEVTGIDFSILRGQTMKISGRVFDAIAGGASVSAIVHLTGRLFSSFQTNVDANGKFEFSGVPAGDYVLWASDMNRNPGEKFTTRSLVVEADVSGIELAFRPAVSVKGHLTLEDGRVFTNPRGLPGITANIVEGTLGRGTNILVDGSFTLGGRAGLIEGEYRISVEQLPEDYYVKSISFGATDLLKETLKLTGPTADGVAVTLGAGTSIAGGVVDENQQPAANVRMYLVPRNPIGSGSRVSRSVLTDQSGNFVFRGVPPGTYGAFAVASFFGIEPDEELLRDYEARSTVIAISDDPRQPHAPHTVKLLPYPD